MEIYIGAQVMVDLVVWPAKACWRWHVGESTPDIVSKRSFLIGDKHVGGVECISVCLEVGVDDESVCRFCFMVSEEC